MNLPATSTYPHFIVAQEACSSTVDVRRLGTVSVVTLTGAMDVQLTGRLTAVLLELVRAGTAELAIDVSDLAAVDYSFCGSLARAHIALKAAGGRLTLIACSQRVFDLLRISGMARVVSVFVGRARPGSIGLPLIGAAVSRSTQRDHVILANGSIYRRRQVARDRYTIKAGQVR